MKTNYFIRFYSMLFLSLLITSLSAKDIYLSATGDDTKDGLTAENALASITKALDLLADGDVIRVSGIIDLTQTSGFLADGQGFVVPIASRAFATGFSIIGDDKATSGFDGKKQGRFGDQFAGYGNATATITFKNLTFKDLGKSGLGGGSSLRILNNAAKTLIDNCDFTGSIGTQGTILSVNAELEVRNSKFYANTIQQGNAVFFNGHTVRKALIENCIVEDNDCSAVAGSSAGAFRFNNASGEVIIRNTTVRRNKILGYGAVASITAGEDRSAAPVVLTVKFENSLLSENETPSHSPGIQIENTGAGFTFDVSLINTTVYGNKATTPNSGVIWIYRATPGSKFNVINSTIVNNWTAGNAGHAPGLRIVAADVFTTIHNSIIENNTAEQTAGNPGDLWFSAPQTDGVTCDIRNSYISYVNWGGANPYASIANHGNVTGYIFGANSGLAWPFADYIASRGCIPLDFESPALTGGDAKYLKDLGISTDQEGTTRLFADDKCAVGAVESTVVAGIVTGEEHNYTHYIISGQSLSTGHESDPLSITNIPGNYMLGDRIWINNGNASLNDINPLVATTVPGPQAESPLHGAINHLRNKIPLVTDAEGKENRFLASSVGVSGKTIEELSKEYQGADYLYRYYETGISKGKSMALRRGSTINCPAIIFMQGEWNYQTYGTSLNGTSTPAPTALKDEYKDLFLQLKGHMQADVKAKYEQSNAPLFYTYQTGVQYSKGRTLEIGMAQLEAANENDDVIMVGPVYPMTDVGGHLDANGYRWYGEMIGKVIYKTQVLGETFSPLQPIKVERVEGNAKQLKITYHVPNPPLELDVYTLLQMPNYGFNLYHNNAVQAISSVEVVGPDAIIITASADLTGAVEITYAGVDATASYPGKNLRGHGNVRDSDTYGAFFNYEQKAWVSTATQSGEPTSDGTTVIYNQPYPLYNFSVAFYYKLAAGEDEVVIGPETSIGKQQAKDGFSFYQSGSDLYLSTPDKATVKLDIYTISGGLVKSFAQETATSAHKYALDTLSQGLYIAKANVGNNVYSAKIIIK
ncbi:T9SS type A sorting domain-containing protein [Viscerimonas tarda]